MGQKQETIHGAEQKRIEKRKEQQEQKQHNKKEERKKEGRVAQSVERTVDNGKVVGSKPTSPMKGGRRKREERGKKR